MRLRLTIQRNGLPAANILWPVPATASATAYTITRLLEDVTLIVPLEAEHWGLEHYVVELGGFECLHFMPVAQCLKEDDCITIRPLMRAEERARTLTGRHQISHAGQHLVDGVPFGRPYLRQPSRPAVRIPPTKPQRLEDMTGADESQLSPKETTDADEAQLLLEDTIDTDADAQLLLEDTIDTDANAQLLLEREKPRKTVHFRQPEVDMDLDGGSDDDDDDFAPGADVDTDHSDTSDSDDSSDASDSSDSDSSSDDSSSGSDSDAEPEVRSSKKPPSNVNVPPPPTTATLSPPGEGKKTTQSRNARRTKTNRLNHLKKAGKLDKDADLKDLERYEDETRLQQNGTQPEPGQLFAHSTGKRKRLETDEQNQTAADEAAELARRKQDMMAKLGHDSDVLMADPATKDAAPSASTPPQQKPRAPDATPEKAPERKRLRPDVSAIGRMLARQTKDLVKKPVKAKDLTPEPEGSTDPEFWKSRINLSAFECWEEEYELKAPPFPFQQHWDPIGKVMRDAAKARKGKGNKGRKKPAVEEPQEKEDEEEKIYLNYDDTPNDSPGVQVHAAIEDQLQQDIATASQEQTQDDFPVLPQDLSTLPDLTPADIKAGALIVCKFFAINPVTVTPEISSFKTAVVEQEGDSGAGAGTIRLRIAQRHLPRKEKKFNSKGERIYDANDGFFMDEDKDEEEGLWSGMFSELVEGKLLRAA